MLCKLNTNIYSTINVYYEYIYISCTTDPCCCGKAMSVTYCVCLFINLGILHAIHMHPIIMWPGPHYNIFPHFLINGTIFGKALLNTKYVFGLLYIFCLKCFSFYEKMSEI